MTSQQESDASIDVKSCQDNLLYWEITYSKDTTIPANPSSFCSFLIDKSYLMNKGKLLDIGCGNGRDTFELAKYMDQTIGIDASLQAVHRNNDKSKQLKAENVSFEHILIDSTDKMTKYKDFDYFYARFFMHAIDEKTQGMVMEFFSTVKVGACVFLEFRTTKDPLFSHSRQISQTEGIHTHYRRFINYESFIKSLEKLHFEINYHIESQDLSKYKDDNPCLARIVAKKIEKPAS